MVSRLTYTKLGSTEGESTAWIDEHFDSQGFRRKARHRKELVVGLLWVSSLACAVGLTRWYDNSWLRVDSRSIQSVAAVDYNSPLYGHLNFNLDAVTPDRSLWDTHDSIYRQDPSPEVDAAWTSLVNWNPILLSKNDLHMLGLPTKGTVRWTKNDTTPSYVGRMDVFHLLHCVNELRKAVWFNYYERNETLNPAYYVHKKHCLEIIRQEIMCTGSLNVYRLLWIEHQTRPWPEFTIHRQCRRWDDLLDWYHKNKMSDEDFVALSNLKKPDNGFVYPMPPEGIQLVQAVDAWEKKWGIQEESHSHHKS